MVLERVAALEQKPSTVGMGAGRAYPSDIGLGAFLAVIERLAKFSPPLNTNSLRVFLYACLHEGMSVSELAHLCGLHVATAARLVRGFGVEDQADTLPPAHGLLEIRPSNTDRRLKHIFLTPAGRTLKAQIEALMDGAAAFSPAQ